MPLISKRFSFKVLVPIWLVAFGLVAVSNSPMTFANGVLLLMVALVVPAVVTILLLKDRPSTIAEVLNRVERSSIR
jgi:undecaprenyl pyrophosphate phosphatase UppP